MDMNQSTIVQGNILLYTIKYVASVFEKKKNQD